MIGFDPTDLRLRVQTGLSAPEMRRLLETWGASPSELSADNSALAHYVVRVGAKRFGPAELIRRLAVEKPLVEWPEVPEEPDSRWAGPMSIPGPTPPPPEVVPSELLPEREGPARDEELAPSSVPGPASLRAPASVPPASRAPSSQARPSGLVFQDATALRGDRPGPGMDPRLLVVLGGIMVLLTALAFSAGLVWRSSGATPAQSASAAQPDAPSPRSSGLAGRAASMVDERLLAVAQACGLTVTGVPTREVLELAQEACGRDEAERQRRTRDRGAAGARANDDLDDDPLLPVAREPQASPRPADTKGAVRNEPKVGKTPALPAKSSCSTACSRVRAECTEGCGAEPSDAAQYDRFQACTGRCVVQETRCRSSCF